MRGGAFFNGKEGRDDFRTPFLNDKEGRVGFRKNSFLTLKKDGMILEKMVGEVPGAYFIKLLFGSWHGACLLIDIER